MFSSSDTKTNTCYTNGEPSNSNLCCLAKEQELILTIRQPLANFRSHLVNINVTCQLPYNTFRVSWIPALFQRLALSLVPIKALARFEPS